MKRLRLAAALLLALGGANLAAGYYIPAKAAAAQVLLRLAWKQTKSSADRVRPWPWARTWPVLRLEAPRTGYDAIVLAGAEGAPLAFGPGHVDGTPLPGGNGNTVIAGHRDTQFRFLKDVELGDEILAETSDRIRHRFVVVDTRIVRENETRVLGSTGEGTLTLVTCYPFDAVWPGGPLRYVVRAVTAGERTKPERSQNPFPPAAMNSTNR